MPRFNVDLFFSGVYESRILLEKIEKSMTRLAELQSPMLQAHLPEAICSLSGLLEKIIVRCHRDTHRFISTLADMMEQLRYYDYMGIGSDEYHQLRAEKQYSLGIRFKGALVKLQKLLGHCSNLFHERLLALLVETVPSSEIDQLRELLNTEAFDLKLNAIVFNSLLYPITNAICTECGRCRDCGTDQGAAPSDPQHLRRYGGLEKDN